MGAAIDWQTQVLQEYENVRGVAFYNPRRADWDSSWTQELSNEQFTEQVNWELDMLKECDCAFFFFPANSQAPITLMEFGIVAASQPYKMVVVAEPGYWRRGNLEVVCNRERIAIHADLNAGLRALDREVI